MIGANRPDLGSQARPDLFALAIEKPPPLAEAVVEGDERIAEFRERFANPYVAAERGYVDEVIEPARTRPKLIAGLRLLDNKRDSNPPRKHGNIPL